MRAWCEMLYHKVIYMYLFSCLHCTLAKKRYLSQVSLGEICKVTGKGFIIMIKILIQCVGKWGWHASSARCIAGICLWWMPRFDEVCLSLVGPVPLGIYNYIFISSEMVCLLIKALLWNGNPSGVCSRAVFWFRFGSSDEFFITELLVILISFSLSFLLFNTLSYLNFLSHFRAQIACQG